MAWNCLMGLQNVQRMALTLAFHLDEIIIKSFYDWVDLLQVISTFRFKLNLVLKSNNGTKFRNIVFSNEKYLCHIHSHCRLLYLFWLSFCPKIFNAEGKLAISCTILKTASLCISFGNCWSFMLLWCTAIFQSLFTV